MVIKVKHLEFKHIYFIFLTIWTIDFITTFIALVFSNNFIEANPLLAPIFNLGWYGWFIVYFFSASVLFILTKILFLCKKVIVKFEKKHRESGYSDFYLAYVCGVFSGFEILTIINNIGLLLRYGI